MLSSFSYTYRGDGNIASERDHNNVTIAYTYDLLGRLVSEVGGYSRYYSYDAAGNRTQAIVDTSTTISYTYDSDGRLVSEISNNGSSLLTTSYVYDSNGSLISENDGDVTSYTYDVWGNMTSAGNASYAYNAQGLRVSKTVNGSTDNFVLVGGDVWKDSENTYLRGLELISSSDYFYLYNIRGDVIQLLDYNGEVVKTYDYDAYGNELNRDLSDENPFRYCGEYYDTETGLIYLRARYYDPTIGRFTSVDPIKDGLNWYNYCDSDPLNRIDSTGEAWYHWAIGAAIVVACAAAVVLTAGGALAAVTAVGMVTSGVAATTTATTVASYAFIGSAFAFGGCVLSAGFSAKTPQEFADEGNWGTVLSTAGGAAAGGVIGYIADRGSRKTNINTTGTHKSSSSNSCSISNSSNADNSTGTVWDSITPTQENYPNTEIPKSFVLESNDNKFWVHPNATKHMNEYVVRNQVSHSTPINSQSVLTSFKNSVDGLTASGTVYNKMNALGGWEIQISSGRSTDLFPVIKHALYKP